MNVRTVGVVIFLFGLGVILCSAIVLYDAISHKNRYWELQQAPYVKHGYDVFWDQFKYEADILVILTPLTLLVGLVQSILPALFCCLEPKDLRKTIQLWIGTNGVLFFMTLACFILGIIYSVDTVGIKTYHYNGRGSDTYLSSWWKYDKGVAYLAALGCDLIILFGVIVWMIRWTMNPDHYVPTTYYDYERSTPV